MSYITAAAAHYAPTDVNKQTLANTGATESVTTELPKGVYCTLKVGATPVRVRFSAITGSALVGTTDVLFAAGDTYHWIVQDHSKFVAVEAADGSSAYQVWVWVSSPKV